MEDTKSIPLSVFKQEANTITAETEQPSGETNNQVVHIKEEPDTKTEVVTLAYKDGCIIQF